jgi:hypothetical protein
MEMLEPGLQSEGWPAFMSVGAPEIRNPLYWIVFLASSEASSSWVMQRICRSSLL